MIMASVRHGSGAREHSNVLKIFHIFFYSFTDQETHKLVESMIQIVKPGKLPASKIQIPFKLPLDKATNTELFETYHGLDISIEYSIKGEIKRRLLAQNITVG